MSEVFSSLEGNKGSITSNTSVSCLCIISLFWEVPVISLWFSKEHETIMEGMILRAQGKHFSFIAWQLRLHRQHSVSYVLKLIIFYILKDLVLFPSFKTRALKRKRDVSHFMVSQVSRRNEGRARGGGITLFHKRKWEGERKRIHQLLL